MNRTSAYDLNSESFDRLVDEVRDFIDHIHSPRLADLPRTSRCVPWPNGCGLTPKN